jgi:anti-sigma-K factor RskA
MPRLMSDDLDALAGEYVLGTLDADERAQAQARLAADADFAALVRSWEIRLGELSAMVEPIEPLPHTWSRIKARIGGAAPAAPMRLPEVEAAASPAARPDTGVVDLTPRLRRWRQAAAAVGALAAGLLLFVAVQGLSPDLLPAALRPRPQVGE